jgi:A/G-specific adenine glycosylase
MGGGPAASPDDARAVRRSLLRWYRAHRRDLPWRRTRDPYAIWVSEIMLQQTQVATVIPYYERFMRRFPDAAALARASEEEVLGLWSGLGYYRRARALREGAVAVLERHGGRLPGDCGELQALPGIGRYTAGAIASICFGIPAPILDGNVRRVLSRLHALDAAAGSGDARLWKLAESLADGPDPGDLNQALMEIGALVCTPRNPECDACPLGERCRARALGSPESFPPVKPRRAVERVRVAVAVVERGGRVLLERPSDGSPFRGTWDLPAIELADGDAAERRLRDALRRRHGLEVDVGAEGATATHGILHRRLRLDARLCRLRRGRVAGRGGLRWLAPGSEAAVSGATRKILRLTGHD